MKRTISGVLMLAFALLGMYCSLRAFQVHRELNGRPDVYDEARNWSVGATACFVACGVVAVTLGRKNATAAAAPGDDAAAGERPTPAWWKSPVGIALMAAAVVVVVLVVILVLQPPPRPVSPIGAPPALDAPRVAEPGPSTVP